MLLNVVLKPSESWSVNSLSHDCTIFEVNLKKPFTIAAKCLKFSIIDSFTDIFMTNKHKVDFQYGRN